MSKKTHKVSPKGGDILGNITVGQGLPCRFRIFVYGADKQLIPGPLPNGCHADGLVVDDAIPEYRLPVTVFKDQKEFWISHEYIFAGIGPGEIVAEVVFEQTHGDVVPNRTDRLTAPHPGYGRIYQHAHFKQA